MSADAPIVLVPERLVAGGDALAHLDDGRVAFVSGGLPDEPARVEIVGEKRDFVRARVREVEAPSPNRVEPACRHRVEGCGGCGWMHLAAPAQLPAKTRIVAESLRRIGRLDRDEIDRIVRPGGSVDAVGYRTGVRVVGTADRRVGFRQGKSDRVVPVEHCLVAHPRLAGLLPDVRIRPGLELSLRISRATGDVTARVHGRRSTGEGGGDVVTGLPDHVRWGSDAWLVESVAGVQLRVSAGSFFQSGVDAAELLVDAVGRAAPELTTADHAVDAYGGVGLFAATVQSAARTVTLVESSRRACADARVNLAGRDATVVHGDVGAFSLPRRASPVDVIVADPSRAGLGVEGVAALVGLDAPVVVLVSCDPVSMARDARLFAEHEYRAERAEVLDVFPQTPHVEVVTRFTR